MTNDFYLIISWWFLFFVLGVIFFPLTWFFFKKFFDRGYGLTKIVAILLTSYLVWLAGSLRILSFSLPTIGLIILFLAALNFFLARKWHQGFRRDILSCWKILLLEEILFFSVLSFWSFIRGFQPDILGLEKFMDFGFINSILRSNYFPPADMWMSGKTINYYYFGHLVAAILTKLSGMDSAITYNLMIATVFALAFGATFSLGSSLFNLLGQGGKDKKWQTKIVLAGLLAAILLTLGGNLHPLYWAITNRGFSSYWYPDATRFIVEKFGAADNTIHEFPIYSFVVSDLHGHVSDIPFVLLFLCLLFSFLISDKYSIFNIQYSIPLALVLAVMYMTNSWDFPIYFLIIGATIFYLNWQKYNFSLEAILRTGFSCLILGFLAIFLSLPFHLHFSPIVQGIDFVHAHSPFWQLLVLWGYQWFVGITFLIFHRFKKLKNPDIFILVCLIVATFLIIIPEFIFVKDIYIASYHRANTMFKLVYQSFMLYALASGYIVIRVLSGLKREHFKILLFTFYFLLFTFVFIYPCFAVKSYYGNFKIYHSLYGISFLKRNYPEDFEAILWLKENIKGQPVILEASGDSYTDYNRVSALTGLPTVEGWLVHEWLWRGGFDEPGKRGAEVQAIYETKDPSFAKELLEKYQVRYVYIGDLERQKYQVSEEKFIELGKIIFQKGNTKIYLLD